VIAASRAAQAYRRVESESRSPLPFAAVLYDGVREASRYIDTQTPALAPAAGVR